jgi:hypothetical protein
MPNPRQNKSERQLSKKGTFTLCLKDTYVYLYLGTLLGQLKPQKSVWHDSIRELRQEFRKNLNQMKSLLSKPNLETAPSTVYGGTCLLYCSIVLSHGLDMYVENLEMSTAADYVRSIKHLVEELQKEITEHLI